MSVTEHRQNVTGEQQVASGLSHTTVEQLPFPESPAAPDTSSLPPAYQYPAPIDIISPGQGSPPPPAITQSLIDPRTLSNATRQLTEVETGSLYIPKRTTTTLREPVIIPGSGDQSTRWKSPPKGRRLVVHIAVTSLLFFIVLGTLLAVLPTGSGAFGKLGIFNPSNDFVPANGNNNASIVQEAATATAVTQDGFDPGMNTGQYAGVPTPPPGYSGNGNHFYYGQCTYWAAMRYQALTGKWVPWLGNANQWVYGAQQYNWIVSPTPKLYSIIVLQAGVQGAGYYGHVAIVEKINADGSVVTSNWNWAGYWGTTTMVTFTPGPGVDFVWAP